MTAVLIDGKALNDDSAQSGLGTYVRHLVKGVSECEGIDVSVLVSRSVPLPPHVRAERVARRAPRRWALREHDMRLPRDIARARADVFHSPGIDPPRRCNRPWVQTLHDVIPLVFDDTALAGPRARMTRQLPLFRSADAVVAVSHHAADQGLEVLGLDARKVHVIPHGVDPVFRPSPTARRSEAPYLVLVSPFDPRKGYAEAFEVVAEVAARGFPHRLEVAGKIHPLTERRLRATVASAGRPDRIDLLDYVTDLPALYQGASVAIVTSRYEGFGLPALEAMACGTPVVAFDNTATSEIVADGGVLIPDGDVPAFAKAVLAILESETHREELSERALARAKAFDWDRSAAEHAEIYRDLARG